MHTPLTGLEHTPAHPFQSLAQCPLLDPKPTQKSGPSPWWDSTRGILDIKGDRDEFTWRRIPDSLEDPADDVFPEIRVADAVQRVAVDLWSAYVISQEPGPGLEEAEIPVLLATGPEFLGGSTRMTAGTAQKIALNLFSTQTMMALGRVYQGFMVDVVPSNAKLVARAKGIVQALTGATPAEAAALWERAAGDLKLAVLLDDGVGLDEARARLEAAGGDLRRARRDDRPVT